MSIIQLPSYILYLNTSMLELYYAVQQQTSGHVTNHKQIPIGITREVISELLKRALLSWRVKNTEFFSQLK